MSRPGWMAEIVRAGAVPAHYVPEASLGRPDLEPASSAELVEDERLSVHQVDPGFFPPAAFLDGIQLLRIVAYDGVNPVGRAYVAAAVRRRSGDGRLRTVKEDRRDVALARLEELSPAVRQALAAGQSEVVDVTGPVAALPGGALEALRRTVDRSRVEIERRLGERFLADLGADEWLIQDGLLSESARLAAHPRVLGVIKSHGAQYFAGPELETALRLPAGCRTSVFRPHGRARHEVYSWYLRLWPWEGNDLLYGLLRVEARAHPDSIAQASRLAGWLLAERAPLSTPDARWDRLLYPIHDVETYLNAHAPPELRPAGGSRLPAPAA